MANMANRVSIGSMGYEKEIKDEKEIKTKGMHFFDYNATHIKKEDGTIKEIEELAFVSLEEKTPLSVKCVTPDNDLVFTNEGLVSIVLSDQGQKLVKLCPISKLKEAVSETINQLPQKKEDLEKVVKSIEYGLKKNDFDGKVVGFKDGNVYLSLVRQREISMPDGRVLYDYPPLGLFYLHFENGDFSKIPKVTYMPDWKPSTIWMKKEVAEEYNKLYLAIGCTIKGVNIRSADDKRDADEQRSIENYVVRESDPEQRYRIIDFDVLNFSGENGNKTYVSAVVEDKKTGLCSVHIIDDLNRKKSYTPEKWVGRNSINPVCSKLYKPPKEDKLFCFVGCYEGDMVVLECDISNNKISEPKVRATHCFLSKEEIDGIEDIDERRSGIKQIFVTDNDNILFSLANTVMRIEFGELSRKPINYYNKKEGRMGLAHFGAPHMITAFDYYSIN